MFLFFPLIFFHFDMINGLKNFDHICNGKLLNAPRSYYQQLAS